MAKFIQSLITVIVYMKWNLINIIHIYYCNGGKEKNSLWRDVYRRRLELEFERKKNSRMVFSASEEDHMQNVELGLCLPCA